MDVTVEVASDDRSRVVTNARFVVEGGKFHGFDLADLPGAELVPAESTASLDDGRALPLSFQQLPQGMTRVALAKGAEVKRGGVSFTFVHRMDLLGQGALRAYAGRARLSLTPIVWDMGMDVMRVRIVLPRLSTDGAVAVDAAVARDYKVEADDAGATLTKYRPVRWYPMLVVADFDPALVPALALQQAKKAKPAAAAVRVAPAPEPKAAAPVPRAVALLAVVALAGFLALALKARHVERVHRALGIRARFHLLARTSIPWRLVLAGTAVGLGVFAQQAGSVAAGVLPMALAAALLAFRTSEIPLRPRPGGAWRRMDDTDVFEYRKLAARYRRLRRTLVDISTPLGVVGFVLAMAGLAGAVIVAQSSAPRLGWAAAIDGLLLCVPAWFGSVRAELPVDPTLEGFLTLKRWRRSLCRLIGRKSPGAEAELWVREDADGPIEVRLRVSAVPEGLRGIEIAGEVLRSGSLHRTRTVVVLRLEPGTPVARRLAACPHAAEHHLTPDLEEEIIVLRNRRGRTASGLAPLRAAYAILAG